MSESRTTYDERHVSTAELAERLRRQVNSLAICVIGLGVAVIVQAIVLTLVVVTW